MNQEGEGGDKAGRAFCFMALRTFFLGHFTSGVSLGLLLLCGAYSCPSLLPLQLPVPQGEELLAHGPHSVVRGGKGGNGGEAG